MLQVNTKQNTKRVEIDGFGYLVRRLGAGESLIMQKSGREISKLGKLGTLNSNQQERLEDLTLQVLEICLSLFSTDDKKAKAYIQTLDVEILTDVINQIFEGDDAAEAS